MTEGPASGIPFCLGRRLLRAGAVVSLLAAFLAPLALAQGEAEEEEEFGPIGLYLDEDDAIASLLGRAERSVAEGNLRAAVEDYGRILEKYHDKVVRAGDDLYLPASEVATDRLFRLGREGLRIYRLLADGQAETLYERSVSGGDGAGLARIVERGFASSWGDDAAYALGVMNYDAGNYRQARALWQRVLDEYPDPGLSRGVLAARISSACARLGLTRAAKRSLAGLGTDKISVDDRALDAGEYLRLRLASAPKSLAVRAGPWSTYGGDAAHRGAVPALKPVDVLKWLKGLPTGPAVPNPYGGYRPRTKPARRLPHQVVSDGDLIFLARQNSVHAHQVATFAEKWSYSEKPQANRAYYGATAQVLHPLFCTVHGGKVYAKLGQVANMPMHMFGRMPAVKNKIVCLSAGTGRLLWDSSSASTGETKAFLDETYFATAPTVTEKGVYGVALASGSLRDRYVICLDPGTGRMLWRRFICSGTSPTLMSAEGIASDHCLPVTVANGRVYVETNVGALVCLDAETGALRWIKTYERLQPEAAGRTQGFVRPGQTNVKWVWYPTPPVAWRGLIIVAPQDSHALMAIDGRTGREVWRLSGTDAGTWGLRYVLGVSKRLVVLSGDSTVALDAASGKVQWISPVKSAGRGALTDAEVIVPAEDGLKRIELSGGKLAGHTVRWSDGAKEKGHLFAVGDVMIATGEGSIASFVDETGLMKQLLARAAAGGSPQPHFEIGGVHYRRGRYKEAVESYLTSLKISKPGQSYGGLKANEESKAELYRTFVAWATDLRDKGETNDAVEKFHRAHGYATDDRQRIELTVSVAKTLEGAGRLGEAVAEYQRIITDCPDAPFEFEKGRVTKGCIGAEIRIAKMIDEHGREVYARFDAAAKEVYEAGIAAGDAGELASVVTGYPNSQLLGPTLMKLAELKRSAGDPRGAARTLREHLRRFGPPYAGEEGKRTPQVLSELAESYIAAKMLGPARSAVRRLTDEYGKAKVVLGGQELTAVEAAKRLRQVLPEGARLVELMPSLKVPLRSPTNQELGITSVIGGPLLLSGPRPAEVANIVHLGDYTGNLEAREGRTGKILWRRRLPARPSHQLFVDDKIVFLTQGGVFALHAANGKEIWRREMKREVVNVRGRNMVSYPWRAVAGEGVVGVLTQAGRVELLDSGTGEVVWRRDLAAQLYYTCSIADDALIVVSSNPRKVHAFDLHSGAARFEVDTSKTRHISAGYIAGGALVLGGGNQLTGYDMRTGRRLWGKTLQGFININTVKVYGENLIVGSSTGVICYDPASGREIWKAKGGGHPRTMSITGDTLSVVTYVSGKNSLTLLDLAAGGRKILNAKMPVNFSSVLTAMPAKERIFCLGVGYMQSMVTAQGRRIYRTQQVTQVCAYDRKTGRLAWSRMFPGYFRTGQLVDGALWIGDHRTSRVLIPVDVKAAKARRERLKKEVALAPDVTKLLALSAACSDLGKHVDAIGAASRAVGLASKADEASFKRAYAALEAARFEAATDGSRKADIPSLSGRKVRIDGRLDDWQGIKAEALDDWRQVEFPVALTGQANPKPKAWAGPKDCSARVRMGWSKAGLHVAVEVTDEKHSNPEVSSALASGDSVLVAIDIAPLGGYRYDQKDVDIGFALDKQGKKMSSKWLYGRRMQPVQAGTEYAVRRDEKKKTTTYEILIGPADLNGLAVKAGARFGISVAVNDADDSKVEAILTAEPSFGGARAPVTFTRCRLR